MLTDRATATSTNTHKQISWRLANQLAAAARGAGLQTVQSPRLQLGPARTLTPDVAVGRFGRAAAVHPAPDATLIAEVTAPGADTADRALHYAEAGVDWYLVAEPDFADYSTVTLRLLHREGLGYVRHTVAHHGQTLTSRAPFRLTVDTTALVDF
jgi:hypothetical protein